MNAYLGREKCHKKQAGSDLGLCVSLYLFEGIKGLKDMTRLTER